MLYFNHYYLFSGLVHDLTDSYVGALYFTSLLSLSCVFLWFISGLWTPRKDILRLTQRNPEENSQNV